MTGSRAPRPSALLTSLLTLALAAVLPAVAGSPAEAARPDGRPGHAAGCATPVFDEPVVAGIARTTMPKRFRTAMQSNGSRGAVLAAAAGSDRTLWLDTCGKAFYVDPAASRGEKQAATATVAGPQATAAATALVPLTDTFTLQSRPGANRTIWLDFKGGTFTGTAWNGSYGSTITAEPYSSSDPVDTSFSDAELLEIQKAWQVVAEDYAPFDVNVVLADPGTAALDRTSSSDLQYGARAVITNGGPIYTSCGCGGIAYVNVYNSSGSSHLYYQPAWVFSAGTGKTGKNMGEAASHEIGHNFGLSHDATATASYYSGASPWAPVMGVAYSQPISQFSKGEYPGASTTQDDLAIIANGAPLRADDHGDTSGAATVLSGANPTADGVITTRADVDAFRFTGAGASTVTVNPAAGLPDLDVQLTVVDETGATVAVVDPASARVTSSQASGLGASWSGTLPAGGATYTVLVDGVGTGDPLVAGKYSDYGSLGNYQVQVATGAVTATDPLVATGSDPAHAVAGTAWSATPVSATGGVAPYTWSASGLPAGLGVDPGTGTLSGTPTTAGTSNVTVSVTDAAGASAQATVAVVVDPAPVAPVDVPDQAVSDAQVATTLSRQLTALGGNGTYAWSVSSGSLPGGLTLSSTGVLSGTPTNPGSYAFGVAVDSAGMQDTAVVSVDVAPAPLVFATSSTLPNASTRKSYSTTVSVTGGQATFLWSLTSGTLPPGLTLGSVAGRSATISGQPTRKGTWSFTLQVVDGNGTTVSRTFKLAVK
jgi:hypothetical protein